MRIDVGLVDLPGKFVLHLRVEEVFHEWGSATGRLPVWAVKTSQSRSRHDDSPGVKEELSER